MSRAESYEATRVEVTHKVTALDGRLKRGHDRAQSDSLGRLKDAANHQ